jgi:hypothetical protein
LERNLLLKRRECYIFLDGAEYNRNRPYDTLDGEFDFLCTSEGYPLPKSEQYGSTREWFMSGWTKEESVTAFVHLHSDTEEVRSKAREAYALCGGRMRDMRHAFDDPEKFREWLIGLVHNLNERQFCLYSSSTVTMDPFLTLFREDLDKFDCMSVRHYVDSKFLWRILARKLGTEPLVDEFNDTIERKCVAMAGWHFVNTVHSWFSELLLWRQENPIIESVSDIEAAFGKNCGQLIPKEQQYWVPHSLTFRNIDSAVVINNSLYAFVVTVGKQREFQASTFFHDFCGTMLAFNIASVKVCVITTKPDFAIDLFRNKVNEEVQSNSTSPDCLKRFTDMKQVSRDCCMHFVNMNDVKSFRRSMNGLLTAIRHFEERKRKTPTAANPGGSSERSLQRSKR